MRQAAQLLGRLHVSAEDDYAAGRNLFDERARVRVELRARKADVEKLSDLPFERERLEGLKVCHELDDSFLQPEENLAGLFRREGFYINASKLVKEAAVRRVE